MHVTWLLFLAKALKGDIESYRTFPYRSYSMQVEVEATGEGGGGGGSKQVRLLPPAEAAGEQGGDSGEEPKEPPAEEIEETAASNSSAAKKRKKKDDIEAATTAKVSKIADTLWPRLQKQVTQQVEEQIMVQIREQMSETVKKEVQDRIWKEVEREVAAIWASCEDKMNDELSSALLYWLLIVEQKQSDQMKEVDTMLTTVDKVQSGDIKMQDAKMADYSLAVFSMVERRIGALRNEMRAKYGK
jgi:hypothetical protein